MSKRYCPLCETELHIEHQFIVDHNPAVIGHCPNCDWHGKPGDFFKEFSDMMTTLWAPYVSINIETTGLDPNECQILEFGAVIDDWRTPIEKLPSFRRYLLPSERIDGEPKIVGQPYALALNAEILRKLADPMKDPEVDLITILASNLGYVFANWLRSNNVAPMHVFAAGKNFASFDLQFLLRLDGFSKYVHFKHRTLDPTPYFWQPDTDTQLPNTSECLRRAGYDDTVAHTTVEDCISVIQLIRRGVRKCQLFAAENATI